MDLSFCGPSIERKVLGMRINNHSRFVASIITWSCIFQVFLVMNQKDATTKTLLNKYRSVDVDGLVVLTEKLDEGHKNEYYMLPMQLTWREALAGLTLIEYGMNLMIIGQVSDHLHRTRE